MELTLWWVEKRDWAGNWQPEAGPYVSEWDAIQKRNALNGDTDWGYRESDVRVVGMTVTGVETW